MNLFRGSIVVLAMLLSACSGNKVSQDPGQTIVGATSNTSQAYASSTNATVEVDTNGFRVNAMSAPSNQTYYFTFDSSKMRPQDYQALMVQATYLAAHPGAKVQLFGNTDARGSREYNIGLGWRRDQSVARLLEQQGVKPQQIIMVSYGKERPAVAGSNPRAWALNRRVNFIYKVS